MTGPSRLVTMVRKGKRPVCVMVPGAGGGLNPYLRLASTLGRTHNVYGVLAAGLVPGSEPETTVAGMAEDALALIDAAGVDPALLFGWSLGGTVAWEVAVRLAARGATPDLAIVDSSPLARPSTSDENAEVREVILAGLGPRPHEDTRDRVLRVLDAQIASLDDYRTASAYSGRVLLRMCTDDGRQGRDEIVARYTELAPDLDLGWLAAGHFAVFEPEHLPQLAGAIEVFVAPREPSEVAG